MLAILILPDYGFSYLQSVLNNYLLGLFWRFRNRT